MELRLAMERVIAEPGNDNQVPMGLYFPPPDKEGYEAPAPKPVPFARLRALF